MISLPGTWSREVIMSVFSFSGLMNMNSAIITAAADDTAAMIRVLLQGIVNRFREDLSGYTTVISGTIRTFENATTPTANQNCALVLRMERCGRRSAAD